MKAMHVSAALHELQWARPSSAVPAVADPPPNLAPSDSAPPGLSQAPSPLRYAALSESLPQAAQEPRASLVASLPNLSSHQMAACWRASHTAPRRTRRCRCVHPDSAPTLAPETCMRLCRLPIRAVSAPPR